MSLLSHVGLANLLAHSEDDYNRHAMASQTSIIRFQRQEAVVLIAHQQSLAFQVAPGPLAYGVYKLFQYGTLRRLHPLKARLAVPAGIHPVEQQHMKVDIEIERTAEALDGRHRTGAGAPTRVTSLPDLVGGQYAVDDPLHPAHHHRAGREQKTQRIRKAQHPLANRGCSNRTASQVRSFVPDGKLFRDVTPGAYYSPGKKFLQR